MAKKPSLLLRAWPVFLEVIQMGRTISYSELAGRVGPPLHHRHIHRQLLAQLCEGCRFAGLPDLAALVVRKDSGLPGAGWFATYHDQDAEHHWANIVQQCYAFPWPTDPPARLAQVFDSGSDPFLRP